MKITVMGTTLRGGELFTVERPFTCGKRLREDKRQQALMCVEASLRKAYRLLSEGPARRALGTLPRDKLYLIKSIRTLVATAKTQRSCRLRLPGTVLG